MNEASRTGVQEILSALDENSLFSLIATITQGLLRNKVGSKNEAINAIVNYSPDVISILSRKIVTKDILFNYLHSKNVAVNAPATKHELIDKIASFWQVRVKPENAVSLQQYNPGTQETVSSVSILAHQFSQWFYSMLNSNECIGSEHFYDDAKLKLNLEICGATRTELIENSPDQISQHLFLTKVKYCLYFNPNITEEGVQGRVDPHGLVLVLACGTLHSNSECVGVFEQVFSLARDPFSENNWKIKTTEINLKSQQGILKAPSLCDNPLTSSLLNLPNT